MFTQVWESLLPGMRPSAFLPHPVSAAFKAMPPSGGCHTPCLLITDRKQKPRADSLHSAIEGGGHNPLAPVCALLRGHFLGSLIWTANYLNLPCGGNLLLPRSACLDRFLEHPWTWISMSVLLGL